MNELPYTLTSESVKDRLKYNADALDKMNELADRGIILNTWQINNYLLDGDRQYGKTFLAFVKIAEEYKLTGFTMDKSSPLLEYDPDVESHNTYRDFLRGFGLFLQEYYSDVYTLHIDRNHKIVATTKLNKRWWA